MKLKPIHTRASSGSRPATMNHKAKTTKVEHSHAKTLAMTKILTTIFCLGTLLWGCAIEDGLPWGKLSLSLTAQAPYTDARWDENLQALRTTDDARVRLDDITLRLTHISLFGKAGSQGKIFDPNNPPPPYTNCHAGHCHRTDND
ncbi:MAG: hypothetical protein FWC40_08090, partial [Proteobacteria bacterium]|nr:hypothetical protein [Pseudomonadota bacterium]